jgi:hypothetical protein
VISENFEAEPSAEVVLAVPIERERSNHQYGRHPRELHVRLETPNGPQPVSIHVRDKGQIDRRMLLGYSPDPLIRLPQPAVRQVAGLLAGRYDRAAFPDEFEARFERAKRTIKRAFEDNLDKLQEVFLVVEPLAEIGEGESYRLYVYMLVTDSLADGPTQDFNRFQNEVGGGIRQAIRRCDGIQLEKLSVCRADEITLREFSTMTAIDFGSIRFAAEADS